jgi:integrase
VHIRHLDQTFGPRPVEAISVDDVQEWVAVSGAKPSTLRVYLSTLRRVLDHAGIEPNPARSPRIRLPRTQHVEMEPPSASDVESMITEIAPRFRLALTTLAETGIRVGECVALAWPDVDIASSRFRIRSGKTRAARRWVPVPEPLMADILATTPPDDRMGLVFPDLRESSLRAAMRRACQTAGIAHYSPHDLRHRWASVQVARGVPITDISAALGHTDKAMTLNTYSHVLLAD